MSTAHRPLPDVPRWAVWAVWAIQLSVLPSSLWRVLAFTFHVPLWGGEMGDGDDPSWFPLEAYVVVLSLVSELAAFAAFGLVCRWGEVWPRWVPWLRGRRVRPMAAVVPAAAGALLLTVLWGWTTVLGLAGRDLQGRAHHDPGLTFDTWQGTTMLLAYLPLLVWGPLLGALTVHYYRRRRAALRQGELHHESPGPVPVAVAVGHAAAEGGGALGETGEAPPAPTARR